MSLPAHASDLLAAGFFLLRTPLLPYDEVEAWSAGLESAGAREDPERLAAALARDREVLRARLSSILAGPEVREALLTASPGIAAGLAAWERDPDGKRGRAAEESLVRYFLRMATRCTPFGLLSGISTGEVGEKSELRLAARERYGRHSRLDFHYLDTLARDLERDPEIVLTLTYRPNTSLHEAAGRLHLAEVRPHEASSASHHLVAVERTAAVARTLERARGGATLPALARGLAGDLGGEVSPVEAGEFVIELARAQVLVSDLPPAITGPEPVAPMIERLRGSPAGERAAGVLAEVRDELARLDRAGPGADPGVYGTIARRLEALPTRVEAARLFQVDMVKPAAATLAPDVVAEIARGIELLRHWTDAREHDELAGFRRRLAERYGEGRAVPLVEALDREVGVSLDGEERIGSDLSPLLAGLDLDPPAGDSRWEPRHEQMLRAVEAALAEGATAIELPPAPETGSPAPPPLPGSLAALATLAARSPAALARGDFRVLLRGAAGPSGARLLGRFCHADEVLRRRVEALLRAEEAGEPDALFAEIVHLPAARPGNILSRPLLREHEIPYLGRSGAPAERQIPVTDLLVAATGEEVVLTSARHGRRVVPRLTSAHFPTGINPPLYRLLWALQIQGVQDRLFWSWGPLAGMAFLPRVTSGRLVLARARWRVSAAEIAGLLAAGSAGRAGAASAFGAVERWRAARRLPSKVVLVDGDKQLPVLLDNPLGVEAFLSMVRRYPFVILEELFPGPEELCATGPEGRYVHELVVPFLRRREARPEPARPPAATAPARAGRRTFPPGSEWLEARLYTGRAAADRLLSGEIAPLAERAIEAGAVDRWFFVRQGDPHRHLRLCFHGEPEGLAREITRPLGERAAEWIDGGRAWRLQLDTHEREVERYGGAEGIEIAERLWHVDSEAVVAMLPLLDGPEGAEARWKLALSGIDALLSDFGLAGEARLEVLRRLRDGHAGGLGAGAGLRRQLAERLRRWRRELEELLAQRAEIPGVLGAGLAVIAERSRYLAPLVAKLRQLEAARHLAVPLAMLAACHAHLFASRLLRAEVRAHELVFHDFLLRLHLSREGRTRGGGADRGGDCRGRRGRGERGSGGEVP